MRAWRGTVSHLKGQGEGLRGLTAIAERGDCDCEQRQQDEQTGLARRASCFGLPSERPPTDPIALRIQRDEETAKPKLFYAKLPSDIAQRWVMLLDPMLGASPFSPLPLPLLLTLLARAAAATGGSAIQAIEVLISHGVAPERILFLNLVAAPEGLQNLYARFPQVQCVTAWIDEGSDEMNYSELLRGGGCGTEAPIPGAFARLDAHTLLRLPAVVPGLGDFGNRFYSG